MAGASIARVTTDTKAWGGPRSALENPFERKNGAASAIVEKSWSLGGSQSFSAQLKLILGGSEKVEKPYLQDPWVYSCINARVRSAMEAPLRVYASDDPDAPEVKAGKLYDLLARPSPQFSWKKTLELSIIFDCLFGETFWFLVAPRAGRDGSTTFAPVSGTEFPAEFWPVRGDAVVEVIDENTGLVKAWKFMAGSKVHEFPRESVVQVYHPDPYNPLRGVGPVSAALRAIQKSWSAERYDEGLLSNGGMPGGIFTVPDTLGEPGRRQLKESYRENHGKPEAQRTPLVLEQGLKFEPIGFAPIDMQFSEMRDADREVIMAALGVTKPILGIVDDVNRANADSAERIFWKTTVLPTLTHVADGINEGLALRQTGHEAKYRVRFDLSKVDALSDVSPEKVTGIRALVGVGLSFNEAAETVGMDHPGVEGGDDRYLETGLVPVDLAGQPPALAPGGAPEPDEEDDEEDDEPEPAERQALPIVAREAEVVESDPLTDGEQKAVAKMDRPFRERHLAVYEKRLSSHDKRIARKAQASFRKWLLDLRDRLSDFAEGAKALGTVDVAAFVALEADRSKSAAVAALDALILRDIERYWKALAADLRHPYALAWDTSAKATANSLGSSTFIRSTSPEALKYLRSRALKLAEGAYSTIAEDVKRVILRALSEDGPSVGSLASRIEATLTRLRADVLEMANNLPARAERIARTESGAVAVRARVEEMKKDGVEKHMWATAGDALVREEHAALDGVVRVVGKQFRPGLRWPLDEQADASQVVNCRCDVIPVVPEP
jgi:SPP1 gp7 family putative phage head morphogenesis protein